MATILLGVTGGIAAYKAADLASKLTGRGHAVHTVMTANATRFVTPLTFETVTRLPVRTDDFAAGDHIAHIDLARKPDLALVAPATANFLAKLAHGLADDLLSTTLLATTAPIMVAPAMNVEMWRNPATASNVATLRGRGVSVLEPGVGDMACGEHGEGRLPEVPDLLAAVEGFLAARRQLAGKTVLVTAGGTREPIDPVRFIGNRSSGKMGLALAAEAARRGARVVLVAAAGVPTAAAGAAEVVRADTAAQMADAVLARLAQADVLIMAAAVADWRPAAAAPHKLKKQQGAPTIALEPTVDILAEAGRMRRDGQLIVGFAAETEDLEANARAKLAAKGADLVVANDAAAAMEADDNAVVVVGREGVVADLPRQPKAALAAALWDRFARFL
ncbi:MAG: bifunctional phosphopantothenoylcysteine decarboxylase/phosphopantothenate--cysteine ligase CoaBC [Candidatus Sericytochromatia bacterium]|nr:bifunctional phosphopantothenoylcysteine decarboxylase/phosphopantothenate--cysteine ligase CoaBC [Candidatus Tanganyikabacteria bacterium]